MAIVWHDLSKVRVLVIGDIMLDRYWNGDVRRISPEAPVPVVRVNEITHQLGGAANVAANLAALGVQTTLMGAYGTDEAGEVLQGLLSEKGILDASFIAPHHRTTVKLRVMGQGQQLIRLDFEDAGVSATTHMIAELQSVLPQIDIVVFSDYKKGVLSESAALIRLIRAAGKPVLVDPKQSDVGVYAHATMLTPNQKEFDVMVGGYSASEREFLTKATSLIARLELQALLVTQGEHGMTLVSSEGWMHHIPARVQEVYDVTGAGDTVIATLAACLGAGYGLIESVEAANIAAGIVVGKLGTATVSPEELCRSMSMEVQTGVMSEAALLREVHAARARGEKIVFTNGCFDILHAGHVRYLQQARAAGDRLIVALNCDASIHRLKGEGRPINALERRLEVMAGLRGVDWVLSFSEDTPLRLIEAIVPDILVKGGDYEPDHIIGAEIVRAHGGKVQVFPLVEGCSTTAVVHKIQAEKETIPN